MTRRPYWLLAAYDRERFDNRVAGGDGDSLDAQLLLEEVARIRLRHEALEKALEAGNVAASAVLRHDAALKQERSDLLAQLGRKYLADHWSSQIAAQGIDDLLRTAPNFVQQSVTVDDHDVLVTFVKRSGKSPAEIITELRAEIETLRRATANTTAQENP